MVQTGKAFFIVFIVIILSAGRCALPLEDAGRKTLRIMSYNAENIFDDVDNGSEYTEFDPGSGEWNESLYNIRLVNLAEVIKAACRGGPDIIALQEIENGKVAADLVSRYLKGMGYTAAAVTRKENSAVQIGFISRIPFDSVTVHDVYAGPGARTRPVLEVSIKTDAGILYLFNNHWKSRIGGSRETENLRILDSMLLRKRMMEITARDPSADFLFLGDFNESYNEYERTGKQYQTALMPPDSLSDSLMVTGHAEVLSENNAFSLVYTPWTDFIGGSGSYFYKGEWEKIDHTLMSYGLLRKDRYLYDSFTVPDIPFIFTADGVPFSWNTRRGSGYSDHLPLLVTLKY